MSCPCFFVVFAMRVNYNILMTDLKKRALQIHETLLGVFGEPIWRNPLPAIDELVSTILSQNTNDVNRDRAFDALRAAFPTWEAVRDAKEKDVVEAIKPAGLANQKGPRIQKVLQEITKERGSLDLQFLADMPVEELISVLLETGHHGLPVADREGKLVGMVTLTDLQRSAASGDTDQTVADIATLSPITCFPDQTVREALEQLRGRELGRLPVVARVDPTRVIGMLRRENVIAAYSRLLHAYAPVRRASARLRVTVPTLTTVQVESPRGAEVIGRAVHQIGLPSTALLVAVRREERVAIPRGDTVLAAGDLVTGLVSPADAEVLRAVLTAKTAADSDAPGGGEG